MERWRRFFKGAGEDLWTVIEQAILVAANDYPSEFRQRRCDIAEVLFAKSPYQQGHSRASASVVTNCPNGTQAEEVRHDQVSAQRKDGEHGPSSGGDDGQQQRSAFSSVEACGFNDGFSQTAAVCNIKMTLSDSMQSDTVILQALRTLEALHINVDVLKETEIGKQVNNLRKHTCAEIRLLAKGLVRHWKELVDNWVKTEENADAERSMQEEEMLPVTPKGAIQSHVQVEMGQHYLSEFPEERGSTSRAEPSSNVRRDAHALTKELVGRDAGNLSMNRLPVRNGSIGKMGPSRPDMSADSGFNGKAANKVASNDQNTQHSNQRSTSTKDLSQKDHMMDLAKRKLSHECYDQTDNAKKQQKGPVTYSKDLGKAGMTRPKAAISCFATQRS